MVKEFSVAMALVDFIPVILFAVAAVVLQRDLYAKMSKGAFALFAAGTMDIVFAGALKALYKLLYAAGVCDFDVLSTLFMPLQAIGFMLAGTGVVAMLCHRQTSGAALPAAVAPAAFSGTPVFIALMVLGLAGMNTGLCIAGARMKKPAVVVFFIISFVCSLAMGYLSSRDFTQEMMNWVAEGVNIVGQGAFLAGALVLHKAGFGEFDLKGEKNDGQAA